jgi:hypothetical protein
MTGHPLRPLLQTVIRRAGPHMSSTIRQCTTALAARPGDRLLSQNSLAGSRQGTIVATTRDHRNNSTFSSSMIPNRHADTEGDIL